MRTCQIESANRSEFGLELLIKMTLGMTIKARPNPEASITKIKRIFDESWNSSINVKKIQIPKACKIDCIVKAYFGLLKGLNSKYAF